MKIKNNKKKKNVYRRIKYFCISFIMMLTIHYPGLVVAAGQAGEPIIVSGTRKLIAAIIAIFTGLIASIGTFNAFKVGTKWINASSEERPKYQKELFAVILATVVTLTIGSTITYIVGFYQ